MGRTKKLIKTHLENYTPTEKGLLALLGLIAVLTVVLLVVRR